VWRVSWRATDPGRLRTPFAAGFSGGNHKRDRRQPRFHLHQHVPQDVGAQRRRVRRPAGQADRVGAEPASQEEGDAVHAVSDTRRSGPVSLASAAAIANSPPPAATVRAPSRGMSLARRTGSLGFPGFLGLTSIERRRALGTELTGAPPLPAARRPYFLVAFFAFAATFSDFAAE
jgi:hypothetical protein